MSILKKEIYHYQILEKYPIDIEKTNRLFQTSPTEKILQEREYCEPVAENRNYIFYSYKTFPDGSGGYILRQAKNNPKNVVFFGECKAFNCVFHQYLFQVNRSGEIGRFGITGKNIDTGEIRSFPWLSKKAIMVVINQFGRCYCQDSVHDVFVQDDKLIFKVTRDKSNVPSQDGVEDGQYDRYDVDTQYELIVTYKDGKLKATAVYSANAVKPKEEQRKHGLGRTESKQMVCGYRGREKDCPKDCAKCAISIKETGDGQFANNDLEQALQSYRKAAFIEPKFADAWVALGKVYYEKQEYEKTLEALHKAIAIDEVYGEALWNKAITLQKQGRLEEAVRVVERILQHYDDPDIAAFKETLV